MDKYISDMRAGSAPMHFELARRFNMVVAGFYSYLFNEYAKYRYVNALDESGYFYKTHSKITEDTGLSKHVQNKCLKTLHQNGLIDYYKSSKDSVNRFTFTVKNMVAVNEILSHNDDCAMKTSTKNFTISEENNTLHPTNNSTGGVNDFTTIKAYNKTYNNTDIISYIGKFMEKIESETLPQENIEKIRNILNTAIKRNSVKVQGIFVPIKKFMEKLCTLTQASVERVIAIMNDKQNIKDAYILSCLYNSHPMDEVKKSKEKPLHRNYDIKEMESFAINNKDLVEAGIVEEYKPILEPVKTVIPNSIENDNIIVEPQKADIKAETETEDSFKDNSENVPQQTVQSVTEDNNRFKYNVTDDDIDCFTSDLEFTGISAKDLTYILKFELIDYTKEKAYQFMENHIKDWRTAYHNTLFIVRNKYNFA